MGFFWFVCFLLFLECQDYDRRCDALSVVLASCLWIRGLGSLECVQVTVSLLGWNNSAFLCVSPGL